MGQLKSPSKTCKILVCEDGWTSFLIGDDIRCLKTVGLIQLNDASSHCQSLYASQILPRSRQESDDFVSALLSLDLTSQNGKKLVSVDIHKSKEGKWYDSAGKLVTFFNWLPHQPENLGGNKTYAGFPIDGGNETSKWSDYKGTDELNVVCTKTAGHGKNNVLLYRDSL